MPIRSTQMRERQHSSTETIESAPEMLYRCLGVPHQAHLRRTTHAASKSSSWLKIVPRQISHLRCWAMQWEDSTSSPRSLPSMEFLSMTPKGVRQLQRRQLQPGQSRKAKNCAKSPGLSHDANMPLQPSLSTCPRRWQWGLSSGGVSRKRRFQADLDQCQRSPRHGP